MERRSTRGEMEELLQHQAWVRGLALRLVGDAHLAEDLAQEAYVALLEERPGSIQSMRAWLGTVLRNLVRERARSEGNRSHREREQAAHEATASTFELFERVSAHKRVVEAVTDLSEHYRAVLLLRYFDGLTPTQIASKLNLPLSTVKTRLARGLGAMRERLDREAGGDGRAWIQGLVPILGGTEWAAPGPALSWPALMKVGAAAAVIGMVGWVSLPLMFGSSAALPEGNGLVSGIAPGDLAGGPDPAGEESSMPGADSDRAPQAQENSAEARLAAPPDYPLAGRVVDELGRPVGGLVLSFERRGKPETAIAVSTEDGEFEFRSANGLGTVRALGEGYVTLFAGEARAGKADQDLRVVVSKGSRLAGIVVSAEGVPIVGAEVAVLAAPNVLVGRRGVGGGSALDLRFAVSDDAGRFDLGVAIDLPDARLQVLAEGFLTHEVARPTGEWLQLQVIMQRPVPTETDLVGHVESESGLPLVHCRVALGGLVTRTDRSGEFRFAADAGFEGTGPLFWLSAIAPGFGPGTREVQLSPESWPVRLRLPGAASTISGTLVDQEGDPMPGLDVFLDDPTVFSFSGQFDGRLSGSRSPQGALRSRDLRYELLEDLAAGHAGKGLRWTRVVTDDEGRFELEGLAQRDYRLVFFDHRTLVRQVTAPIPAGTRDQQYVFEAPVLLQEVSGVVRDEQGVPLANIWVNAWCRAYRVGLQEDRSVTTLHTHTRIRTDRQGGFLLGSLKLDDLVLDFEGEGWIPRDLSCGGRDGTLSWPLDVRLTRLRVLTVELAGAQNADAYSLVDGDGGRLKLQMVSPGRLQVFDRIPLVDGRSDEIRVSEKATECILYLDGQEVQRLPIQWSSTGITRLVF